MMSLAHTRIANRFALICAVAILSLCARLSQAVEKPTTPRATIVSEVYGQYPNGEKVTLFTMRNTNGIEANVITHGASLTIVKAPDSAGKIEPITLHKNSWEEYQQGRSPLGSTIGRFANRIADARFSIDGKEHKLEQAIHGGGKGSGFQHLPWRGEALRGKDWVGVRFALRSPDGQGGFPGNLDVTVTYRLNADNELSIDYRATTDQPTHVNLTNHAYWNLAGATSGQSVANHIALIHADHYLVADEKRFPSGEIAEVRNTPFDFTRPHKIGARVSQLPGSRYDHCFVVRKTTGDKTTPAPVARVVDPASGRTLEVLATQPGVQFFTGNPKGFCLETQHYPDTPNKPNFPSTLLRPGEV